MNGKRRITASAVLVAAITIAAAGCGGGSDKAACGTFWHTLDNSGSYGSKLSEWRAAASQAQSQPLQGDLNAVASDWAASSGSFTSDGERVVQDCDSLGYPDPNPGSVGG